MEDNKRKLYDALSAEYDLGTFEQFSTDIQDADKRKKLYDATINDYDFGDYDSFSGQLGFSPAQESPTPQVKNEPYEFGKPVYSQAPNHVEGDIYKHGDSYTRTEIPYRTVEYPTLGEAQEAEKAKQREEVLAAYRSAYNRLEAPGEVDEKTLIEWGNNMENAPIEQKNLYTRIMGQDATNRVDLDAVMRSYDEAKKSLEGVEDPEGLAVYLMMPDEQKAKLPEDERIRYEGLIKDKRKTDAVDDVNELHERISSLMEQQRVSDIKMHRDYLENRSTGQAIKDAILGIPVAETPQLQGVIPSSGLDLTPEGIHSNEQNAALTAAGRRWNEMKYLINAAQNGDLFYGLDKALGSIDTWTSDQMLRDNMAIMRVANKFDEEGEKSLTDNERALLDALALNVAVSEMYGDEISNWYKGGEMIGEMVPFIIEMLMNPLAGLGKKAADKVTRKAIEKYGKELVKKNAKKFALTRGAAKLGASVAGATGMALTTGLPAVGADIQKRMLGDATYGYDDEGNIEYTGHVGGEDLGTSAYKAVTSRMLDNVSEMLGAEYANLPLKWLQKAGKGTKLLGWIDNLANSKFGKGVSRFAEKTKWNGPIEEFLEEVHVGLINPLLVGDQSWEEFFTKDNLATIAIGVAVPGAAISTANTIAGAADGAFKVGAQERWKMQNAEAMGYQLWQDNPNGWNDLTRSLMVGQMEDVEKTLKEVYNNPKLTPEQKKVALEYAVYSLQWRTAKGVEEAFNEGKKFIDPMLRDIYGTAYAEKVSPVQANNAYKAMAEAEKKAQRVLGIGEESVDEWLNGRSAEEATNDAAQQEAIKAYQAAKLDFEGRRDRYIAEKERAYMESDRSIQANDNNGMVYATQLKDEPVYITGGNVALNEDGTIDVYNSSETLYVKFPDGHVEMTSPDKFTEVFTSDRTADLKAAKRAEIDAKWKAEFDAAEVQSIEQEKRDNGVVFNMTDAQGEHRIEILNEGEKMSDILLDGAQMEIPTEELNRWKQEAGIQSTENGVQSADAVVDNTTDNVAQTGDNVAPVEAVHEEPVAMTALQQIPKDENNNPIYEQVDSELAWDAIVEEAGGSEELAMAAANSMVEDKKAALKKAEKAKAKAGVTIAEKIAAENERMANIEKAKADLAKWEEIAGVKAKRQSGSQAEAVQAESGVAPIEAESKPVVETLSTEEARNEESPGITFEEYDDAEYFIHAVESKDPTRLQEYLDNFPEGAYRDGARAVMWMNENGGSHEDMRAYIVAVGEARKVIRDYIRQRTNKPAVELTEDVKTEDVNQSENNLEMVAEGDAPGQSGVQKLADQVLAAEAEVNTNPTEAQKEAGNYKKGHVKIGPFNISIEQPKGSVRSGVDKDGKKWEVEMQNTYGYFRGTEGVDGDHIDVFLSNDIDGWNGRQVFVVDQRNADGSLDEHKVMLGFNDINDAEAAYMSNYKEGWQGLGAITGVSIEEFEKWISSSHRKTKAFAEYKNVKTDEGQSTSEDAEDIPRLDKHRVGSGPLTDREVVMESDVYSKVLGKPRYYGKKQREYVARMRAKMAQKATELAEKLNTPIEVRETAEGLTGKKTKAKGWYDVKSGNIVVVVSNHGSIEDIQATVLHEVVAHKGLRQMFGEHFDAFLDNVYNNVDAEIRAEIDALTEKYGNTREATEEYLASLAENTYFEKVNPSLWSRIKQWFLNMLTEAGIKLDFELSDNELRYILWRSHQRLVNPGIYNPVTRITNVAVRARLGIGEYAPAVEEMSHVAEEDAAEYDNKNQDIFVSNAQRAVEGIQQNKATAEQWIAMLKKNGGLKAGEDAWLGLEEWLNEKQGAVTKQEILDYIAQNRIQIEEVQYGDDSSVVNDSAFNDAFYVEEDAYGEPSVKVKDARMAIWLYNREYPFRKISNNIAEITDEEFNELEYFGEEYFKRGIGDVKLINSTRLNYTTEGLENKREIALVVPIVESWNASDEIHFGDAGNGRAVAWVRFGETTDSEGNRVLVIDEIQSKRHQEGREKGYRGVGLAKEVLAAEEEVRKTNRELTAYREPLKEKYNFKELGGSMFERLKNFDAMLSEEERITMDALGQARNEAEKRLQELREQERGIPSAPFEKNWHELAMKRMLRLAAEEGFDKVAWTTGEQQAHRYDMSKVVSHIACDKVGKNGNKSFSMGLDYKFIVDPNGIVVNSKDEYVGKSLADIVGKPLANKMLEMQEGDTISGDGLRIGGEGMKGFYDKMLPSFVQKYTKKWGAKVGEVTMPSLEENNTMWSVDVTPEMQESVMQGQTMFRIADDVITTVDDFNNTHRGAAPTVIIDSIDTLEEQLRAEGFMDEDIEEAKKDFYKELAYYHPTYDKIVINRHDIPKDELIGYLWHENAHRAVGELYTSEEIERAFNAVYGVRAQEIREELEKAGYNPLEHAEESIVRGIEDMYLDETTRGKLEKGDWKAKKDATEEQRYVIEFTNQIINFINNGEEQGIRGRRGRTDNTNARENAQEIERGQDVEMWNSQDTGETPQATGESGETRFRTVEETTDGSIDDVPTQPLTLMERITNSLLEVSAKNKENLELRASALKTFGRDINRVLSLMKAQREYDKSTVDTLVKLAKMYFQNAQLLGEVTPYEVARIMGVLNRSVGKRDISTEAAKLMDILLDAHTNALAGILDKAEKIKAKKVNAAGVEVMGRLDKYGQKRVDEYRAAKGMTPEKLEEAIFDSDNRLAELEQRVREVLGLPEGDVDLAAREYTGDNDVVNVYMDERARLEGLTLAREYKESIQQVQEEIKDLKAELKQAEEDYRLGNIDGKSLKEFRKSVAEAIMESKAELIEGYHSLIYKFQENTKESSQRAKEFAQAQIDRAREIQHNANSDMEGIPADTQGTHPDNHNNAVMNALRSPFPTFQGMLKKFGEKNAEGKGYLYERFMPQATKASDNEFRGKVAARVMIEAKLKEIYGEKANIARFMKEFREYGATVTYREGNEMKQFDLTKGQMLYIYMVNKMADGQMKLRRMGITDDVVAELMTKLPEEAVQFADWAQNELLKDLRGKYNAVHERVFGAPMAAIENYFPIKIRKEARGEKGDVSEVGQEGKPSTVTGSIIKRTKNATAIDLSADAMHVLMEHIDDMEHWAAFAEFNRDLNVLLNYKHFQNQVKNMTSVRYGSGEEMWKNFKKTAQIVSGTYRPSDSSIDRAVQNIAKGLTRSKINFRLYTAIKQLLSAPAFWTDAGVEELAYCYANPKGSFKWALENLPGFAERWQGRTMGNEKLLKSDSDWEMWRNEFVEKATRLGMTPNAAIDALTVAQGARAVYMTKLEQFKKAGYTEQRANEKALQAAAEAYNESQQSSEGMYLSPLQVEGTVASAIFSTFKNSNFGYTRKTAQAVANIKRKMRKGYKEEAIAFMTKQMVRDGLSEENAKKMAEKVYNRSKYKDVANVAMFGFGLNLLWEAGGMAIYMLLGDDDEEKEKMMKEIALRGSLGLLNGVPFGETMISAAMAVKEGDTKYFRLPELVAVSDIKNLAQVLNYDPVRGANDIVNMLTSMGVGVTPQVLTDILVAFGDVEEFSAEELGMFVARLVNAPQSNLDRLMVDDAMEDSAINADEIMRRYAEYKKSKNAPITQFFYPEEEEKKVIKRYEKRFEKLLDERLENVVEDNDAYDLFYKGADARMKSELAKMRQDYLAEDKAKTFEKMDFKELIPLIMRSTKKTDKDINEEYFNLSNAEDEDTVFVIKSVKKALEDLKKDGMQTDEEERLLKGLNQIDYTINKAKSMMEQQPDKAQEYMNNIREKRAEAIKQINNYRKNL